jgi:hypothetical protein
MEMMTGLSESNSSIELTREKRRLHVASLLAFRFERCKPIGPHGNHSGNPVDRGTLRRQPAMIVENKAESRPKREDLAAESSAKLRKEEGEKWLA